MTALWARWRAEADHHARAQLAEHYSVFARQYAARLYRKRVSSELQFDDYAQFAYVGLLEAIDRYDPNRGAQFHTFASYRIEGAVLNGVRSLSERQQQASARRDTLRDRALSLAHRDPGWAERLAPPNEPALPNDPLAQLAQLAVGLALGFMLEDMGVLSGTVTPPLGDHADGPAEPAAPDNAYSRVEMVQLKQRIAALMQQLPEQERTVIYRHYFQQQKFDDIAASLQLTKGRISQVHRAALTRLRGLHAAQRGAVVV